jgi:predicted nucleic acid-binding protein
MISADTNLFVYAIDTRDPAKQAIAVDVVRALGQADAVIALQVVGEFQNALTRRRKLPPWAAAQNARNLLVQFGSFAYDQGAVEIALTRSAAGRASYRDALLLAAADAVGVKALLSEDMTDGSVHGGVEVVNPFGANGPSDRARELLNLSS